MFMEHAESIYNIIPPKEVVQAKPPMHKSMHNPKLPPSGSTFGTHGTSHPAATNLAGTANEKVVPDKENRSLGKAPGSYRNDSTNYMKKGSKSGGTVPSLKEVKKEQPHLLQPSSLQPRIKPPVPRRDEAPPVMNLVTSKNFVVANAVETILAAPKKVSEGAKDYLNKEDFGACPKYLQRIKQDIAAEYDYIRGLQEQAEEANRPQVRALDDEERLALIEGLKAKWEQVNTNYQAGTHLTKLDTVGKLRKKEKYEAELSQIEKDIEKLNKRNILVDQTA
eukprot:gnl/TRDRNA2_/TRDRNA2_172836_c0_seq2.p1 gnl/TRDRNA2_/TRDRNA2_172836_c0~~gnl/TRDRNA2_/TRDRNA2_172836_c0_seq2.p1  ORF type:complete len:309 (+),score=77.98 gnl/TRDRNA2_/TRDRNA2_172836_c0_seq2:91-927(+)